MTIRFTIKRKGYDAKRDHHFELASYRAPLYVRIRDGRSIDWTLRTNILVFPKWWDDFREEVNPHSSCPESERVVVNAAVSTLRNRLTYKYISDRSESRLGIDWLRKELFSWENQSAQPRPLEELFQEFYADHTLSESRRKQYDVIYRTITRFQTFIKNESRLHRKEVPDFDSMDERVVNKLADYLYYEYKYLLESPQLLSDSEDVQHMQRPRSMNTVNDMLKKIRAFANWCVKRGYLKRSPFENYHIDPDVYGTPVCLTMQEVHTLFKYKFKTAHLSQQRDVFVFQCNIGCRVSDLMRFTKADCENDSISYIPAKTIKTSARTVTVPLNSTAKTIINRYKGQEGERLLPYISVQRYNESIKKILKEAGITRQVTILDPLTRSEKRVAICDIASSHLARRTFINSIYHKVKDPSLVASLTGHTEGSRAFSRYRAIDDNLKLEMVRMLEAK